MTEGPSFIQPPPSLRSRLAPPLLLFNQLKIGTTVILNSVSNLIQYVSEHNKLTDLLSPIKSLNHFDSLTKDSFAVSIVLKLTYTLILTAET